MTECSGHYEEDEDGELLYVTLKPCSHAEEVTQLKNEIIRLNALLRVFFKDDISE